MERRTFLVLGASLLGVSACTSGADAPEPTPTPSPPPARDLDAGLRERVAAAEIDLIERYRAVITAQPELAESIGPFLAHHEAHLTRVAPGAAIPSAVPSAAPSASGSAPPSARGDAGPGGAASEDASESAVPSATPSASGSAAASASGDGDPGADAPASPAPAEAQLGALAAMEQDAHRARLSDCDAARSGVLARDLCLIAASEAQHAAVLDRLSAEDAS